MDTWSKTARYTTWMGSLPLHLTRVPLSCLAIPGSHDSGTYSLDRTSGVSVDEPSSIKLIGSLFCGAGLSVISKWSVTQDLTLGQQLEAGIRYFDIRVCVKQGTSDFRFLHGLYGAEVMPAMKEINDFLSSYPKEFVILDFNHFYNMDVVCHNQLLTALRRLFGNRLVPVDVNVSPWQMTLENIWKTQMRVMIFYHDKSSSNWNQFWPSFAIQSPWPNTASPRTLTQFLDRKYASKTGNSNGDFYVWQGVLTPRSGTIAGHLFGSLKTTLAHNGSRTFVEWVKDKSPGPQGINICIADFVHLHDFIPTVIRLNEKIPSAE